MNHELVSTGTIVMNAGKERIWEVLTNLELIKEYLFGTETITDWQVGSNIIFQGEYNGVEYQDKGVVKENIPHCKISYNYWSSFTGTEDKPENYSLVTYEITPVNDIQTKLTWTMKGFASQENRDHSQQGMDAFLTQIKGIAERK